MPRALAEKLRRTRPARFVLPVLLLGAGVAHAMPAAAQVYIYDGPYGPPRGYVMPGPPPGYGALPPFEVRNIVRGMGYWQVSRPRLVGGAYMVSAMDDEGPVTLRVDAFTGRVLSARTSNGAPPIAVPAPPPVRSGAPAVARPAPTAPLPPLRPPEATMAAVTPAPVLPAPAPSTPVTPAPAEPVTASPSSGLAPAAAVDPAVAAKDAAKEAARGAGVANPASAPAGNTVPPANASPSANTPAPKSASADPAAPVRQKTGAGTSTTSSATAGSASVLSRPKPVQ